MVFSMNGNATPYANRIQEAQTNNPDTLLTKTQCRESRNVETFHALDQGVRPLRRAR